jgi:hypothetical protein
LPDKIDWGIRYIISVHLKLTLYISCLFICSNLFSQEINQDINTITVKGVSFRQVLSRLLSNGYVIENLDTSSQTVKTMFSRSSSKVVLNLSISIRVQDSVAEILGNWCYNKNNNPDSSPDSSHVEQAKYTFGPYKAAFLQLDAFAKLFKSEIIYSKTE